MTIADEIQTAVERAFYANCRSNLPAGIDYDTWRRTLKDSADAILWYVFTGRAAACECHALLSCRIYYVLRHMAMMSIEDEDASTDHLISLMKSYSGLKKLYADIA